MNPSLEKKIADLQAKSAEHTRLAMAYMAEYGVEPEGQVHLFLPPHTRQQEIHRLPFAQATKPQITYETLAGEFSALCPFSGLPDAGVVRITYTPGDWILELKSLKYYLVSWRTIGATQEDITAFIFDDLLKHLENPSDLVVTTDYNIRGGIHTVCTVDLKTR